MAEQPIRRADLDDPRVQSGDVQAMEQAQRSVPLPAAATPQEIAAPAGSTRARQEAGGLPGFMFDMPSARPDEPITAGLDFGEGPGPEILDNPPDSLDPRIAILNKFARDYNSREAAEMRDEIMRGGRPQPAMQRMQAAAAPTPVDTDDDFLGAEGEMFPDDVVRMPGENPDEPSVIDVPVVDEGAPSDQEILDEETLVGDEDGAIEGDQGELEPTGQP